MKVKTEQSYKIMDSLSVSKKIEIFLGVYTTFQLIQCTVFIKFEKWKNVSPVLALRKRFLQNLNHDYLTYQSISIN